MDDKKIKIITTEDGSHSLFVPELNETYHSFHGAYRESIHVFLLYGLEAWEAKNRGIKPVRVFEVGFGTGLNAWLTLIWGEQYEVPILYHTIEPYPLEESVYSRLNYPELEETLTHYKGYFGKIHRASWDSGDPVSPYFNIKKEKSSLQEVQLYPSDVVYFDAFAPNKQPELWEKEILEKVVEAMNPGAVFVTYCAAGQLKRNLKELGLTLDMVPGPPGKKEMTRAWKI